MADVEVIASSSTFTLAPSDMTSASHPKFPTEIDLTDSIQTPKAEKTFAFTTPAPEKPTSLVELKNGKLVLKQKLLPLDRMLVTMKEMVSFNEMLQTLSSPLKSIPEAHLPLIAKLAFESDKTLNPLAKRVKSTLLPETGDEEEEGESEESAKLPLLVLESAIAGVVERVNYGVDGASNAMSLWRWEVKEWEMLPMEVREKAAKRRAEREQAKTDVAALLGALPDEEFSKLLPNKEKVVLKDFLNNSQRALEKTPRSNEKENVTPQSVQLVETPKAAQSTAPESGKKTAVRPRKVLDPEKAAQKAEKAEQKHKKGAEQAKAAANMSAWLGKGKSKIAPKPIVMVSRASSSKSDFDRHFQPFVVKKDVELFVSPFASSKPKCPIVLDSEGDVVMEDVGPTPPKDLLNDFLSNVPTSRHVVPITSTWKSTARYNVRDLISSITEAEVNGDDRLVRQLRNQLKSGRNVPVKLLQFHDNVRPAYFGTWSKPSAAVGPRVPFARDIAALDYSYESGDDWDEEDEGGEDVMSDSASATPELDSDEEEDEFAGWMVDDDDVEEGEQPEPTSPPPEFDWPAPPPKRKADVEKEKKTKRRKIITPLVPYAKGPCFEERIGICEHDAFLDYRIHFLNDLPFPIDPFAFVAPVVGTEAAMAPPAGEPKEKCYVIPPSSTSATATAAPDSNGKTKPAIPAPKNPFPDQHLAALLQAIEGSTKPRPVLLEDLFTSFKHLGVKKNAIDAKLKEVCVKEKKVWKVLDEAWSSVGVGAPMTVV